MAAAAPPSSFSSPVLDPVLSASSDRLFFFPIKYPDIWAFYKKAQSSFWIAEELDFSRDLEHWRYKLTGDERDFISHILAFFAASDTIVNDNLLERFSREVQLPEARCFYAFQAMMENMLRNVYASSVPSKLFPACSVRLNGPSVGSKTPILRLPKRGLMPGLATSNEFISRDEGLHTDFACLLFGHLQSRPPPSVIQTIITDAVDVEKAFLADALANRLLGMNEKLMSRYVEFVADRLLVALGNEKVYCVPNPFDFMDMISMEGKTIFSSDVSDYSNAARTSSSVPVTKAKLSVSLL
ncbi:Ribonucleotide reductase small subunit [Mycena indigotica]|uniref:Ribonucleotide reductase small subunit n=1 Tax=Mycena indigotica TaxID=2126181 RepID=A0A8H6S573_9AGAR|nr:Ribonucleotide reductase small subunit [Mycena indigotica]KAF7292553.1 Ribonucleotide reductase small subunit [Mycena indigotica]